MPCAVIECKGTTRTPQIGCFSNRVQTPDARDAALRNYVDGHKGPADRPGTDLRKFPRQNLPKTITKPSEAAHLISVRGRLGSGEAVPTEVPSVSALSFPSDPKEPNNDKPERDPNAC